MNKKEIIIVLLFPFSTVFSATLQVPEEYATIRVAIEAASHGDQIIVAPGTYAENIDFAGKNIVLTSKDPNDPEIVNSTILKPGLVEQAKGRTVVYTTSGPVVQFTRGETSDAVLTGFTITEGVGKAIEDQDQEFLFGAGIYCDRASPKIVGNIITSNGSLNYQEEYTVGGGIYCQNSDAVITGNLIAGNYAAEVGGVFANGGRIVITQNRIVGNEAVLIGGGCAFSQGLVTCNVIEKNRGNNGGGGIFLFGPGTLTHNTIVANSAEMGGNLFIFNGGPCQVANNIIARAERGGGILWQGETEECEIRFNAIWQSNKNEAFQKLIWSDQDGTWLAPIEDIWEKHENIYAEPGFVDPMTGDYHLRPDSLCINTGDPQYVPLEGQTDMDGEDRVYSWRTDIGADEYVGYIWPVAHAGEDRHIPELNVWVTLDGSESRVHDPCMVPQFSWKQISGPAVELVAAHTDQTEFQPRQNGSYEFELVVSDGQRDSHPDIVTVVVGPIQTLANWTEWLVSDKGNGHFYQPVRCPEGVFWGDAVELSMLAGGYLVTLTSDKENTFVFNLVDDVVKYWIALNCRFRKGPWLGAFQAPGSPEPAGGWTWITGEPFTYTAWEPKNPTGTRNGNNEDCLTFYSRTGQPEPTWGDNFGVPNLMKETLISYITEFDPVEWQAEQVTSMRGSRVESTYLGYMGEGYVVLDSSIDPNGKVSAQWDIPFGPRGPRQMSLRYTQNTGKSIELVVEVNGGVLDESLILPDTGGWDHWATVSMPIYFEPGINQLSLSTIEPGSRLNLDLLSFIDENTNIALDKSINFADHIGLHNAGRAVDGDRYSTWKTEGFPQWIEIDLENDYLIRRTQLIWNDDSIYHYQIEVKSSVDNEYTCVVDATQNLEPGTFWAPLIDDLEPVQARLVRLTVLGKREGSGNPHAMGLVEFRINAAIDTSTVSPKPSSSPTI